jgi:hypothetical protein
MHVQCRMSGMGDAVSLVADQQRSSCEPLPEVNRPSMMSKWTPPVISEPLSFGTDYLAKMNSPG